MDLPVASSIWLAVAMIQCFVCTFTTLLFELCELLVASQSCILRVLVRLLSLLHFCKNQKRLFIQR